MAFEIDVEAARSQFSQLLDRVAAGEDIVLTKDGRPIAKLSPIDIEGPPRLRFASAKGEFAVPDDFNDPLPKEIEDLFYQDIFYDE